MFAMTPSGYARRLRRGGLWIVAMGAFAAIVWGQEIDPGKLPPAATRAVDFKKDIQPLFEAHCLKCHGADKQRGGFRLDDKDAAFKGGETYTPAIKAGKSAESPLIHLVSGAVPDMTMPPKDAPLSAEQV